MRSTSNAFFPLSTFLCFLFCLPFTQAQESYSGNVKLMITKKVLDPSGTEQVTKITREGEDIASEEIDQLIEAQITDDLIAIDVAVDVQNRDGITSIFVTIHAKTTEQSDAFFSQAPSWSFDRVQEGNSLFWGKSSKVRPMLGVMVSDGPRAGVFIEKVLDGSGAEMAGLQADDVILKVQGKDVNQIDDLLKVIAEYQAGDFLDVIYLRGDTKQKAKVGLMKAAKEVNVFNLENTKVAPRLPKN